MEAQFILMIIADYNDGDYLHNRVILTSTEVAKFKKLFAAIKAKGRTWFTSEYKSSKSESPEEMYGHIEGFTEFEDLVPYGEYGVHTLESILLFPRETMIDCLRDS